MSGAELDSNPLEVMSLEEATRAQFRLVECITHHFPGGATLAGGDLGMPAPRGSPQTTSHAEAALAEFFEAEDAVLVQGSGTGAIREACFAAFAPGGTVLAHVAPMYHTTRVTLTAMGIRPLHVDFNRLSTALPGNPADASRADQAALRGATGAIVQHARQRDTDRHQLGDVIAWLRGQVGGAPIVVDDNYAALKVSRIGTQLGADLSAFSAFKLLGPEGVGVVIGRASLVDRIRDNTRSGGCQVQGPEALAMLQGMVHSPVLAAIQAEVVRRVVARLVAGEVPGVKQVVAANSAETIMLVQLDEPVAKRVIQRAAELGAAPHPVGAESRHELVPMFYRVSKAALAEHPEWSDTVIRINPLRGGDDLVIDLLRRALADACGGRE